MVVMMAVAAVIVTSLTRITSLVGGRNLNNFDIFKFSLTHRLLISNIKSMKLLELFFL